MPRKRRIQLVGKEAVFEIDSWARAVLALAEQLHREWKATGTWPDEVDDDQDTPENGRRP